MAFKLFHEYIRRRWIVNWLITSFIETRSDFSSSILMHIKNQSWSIIPKKSLWTYLPSHVFIWRQFTNWFWLKTISNITHKRTRKTLFFWRKRPGLTVDWKLSQSSRNYWACPQQSLLSSAGCSWFVENSPSLCHNVNNDSETPTLIINSSNTLISM